MKSKYASVQPDYKNTIALLVRETGWSAETTENVVGLLMQASQEKAASVVEEKRQAQKNAKYLTTKTLLETYRLLRASIESGTEHALWLLKDTEYQRLMQCEISLQNQKVQSVSLQAARNRVLWAQVNMALDCFKGICEESNSGKLKRQCGLLFDRYIVPQEVAVEQILARYHVEKSVFYADVQEATKTLSLLLFGPENVEDFAVGRKSA